VKLIVTVDLSPLEVAAGVQAVVLIEAAISAARKLPNMGMRFGVTIERDWLDVPQAQGRETL
jgi:hypothetical protein